MDVEDRVSRRLKLSDLRLLLTIVQWGSMSKAAAHLNISQSAVSKALGELERTLGVRLYPFPVARRGLPREVGKMHRDPIRFSL